MNKFKKILFVAKREVIKKFIYVNVELYMKSYVKYLISIGVKVHGVPKFISPDVYFDGNDYSKIEIGDNVTISREVMFLTHDYSPTTGIASLGQFIGRHQGEIYISRNVIIGKNCFIGARSSILPGTQIGDNVIIGACSVVKGNIPSNSIVVGNPYRIIGKTNEWAEKILKSGNFFKEIN